MIDLKADLKALPVFALLFGKIAGFFKAIAKKLKSWKADCVLTVLFCVLMSFNLAVHFVIITDTLRTWSSGSVYAYLSNSMMNNLSGKLLLTVSPWSWFMAFAIFSALAIISSIVYYKRTGKFYASFVLFIFSVFVLIWQIWNLVVTVYGWR